MAFHQPFQIIGFHSCDKKVGLAVLNGEVELLNSTNAWDWLGSGIYFWEQNPGRSLQYAEDCAKGKQKFNGKIKTPFVVGAIIELGKCLNLVEPDSISIVKDSYHTMQEIIKEYNKALPVNKGANRALDCAVIEIIHQINRQENIAAYDTIRSPFHEDHPIYPKSNFTENLHIEVCVRNSSLIKGYFFPRPNHKYNPYYKPVVKRALD